MRRVDVGAVFPQTEIDHLAALAAVLQVLGRRRG
jgi:hypothetical protein